MFRDWSDGKKFIAEDLAVYLGLIALSLTWDYVINLFIASGYFHVDVPGYRHPIGFGKGQFLLLMLSVIQLIRKWDAWRYWR